MLVDDNENFLEHAEKMLERDEDIEVEATDSPETVAESLDSGIPHDAIISDYGMPELDGIDLLNQVKDVEDVPFIIFTGKSREDVAIEALNNGADGYFRKGSDTETYDALADKVRKEAGQRRVSRQKENFETILDNIQDVVYTVDDEFNLQYINERGRDVLEIENFEDFGMEDFMDLGIVPEENLEEILEIYQEADEKGYSRRVQEMALPNGEEMCVYTTVVALPDGGYAGVSKDVTELEEQRERAELLATAVGHDIKNKLNVVGGFASFIDEENLEEDEQEYYSKMRSAIEDAERIAKDASVVREIEKEEGTSRIQVNQHLNSAVDRLEDFAEENSIELRYEAENPGVVEAGPMVETMFYNLIENSIEHSRGSTVEVGLEEDEDYVEAYIQDNGKGLPEGMKDEIFDGGGNIGSYIISEIAELYDMELEVDSSEDGTEYRVRARK